MSIVSAIGEAVGLTKNSIRGLTTFIADIRNCSNKDEEEKRVNREMAKIRKKFKDNPKMDGYNRKKYVAKILYMYLLGYEPEFGYTEALRLLSSRKFAEKQMGYLTLSVVLNEDHEMIPLVINSFKTDLEARLEQQVCLALSAICNIGGKTMAEALVPEVEKHAISQASDAMVRKKAAMCLMRLFERYPDLFVAETWRERSKDMLNDENQGVLTAYLSFFIFAANIAPSEFKGLYRTMLRLLARTVAGTKATDEYLYYRVPTPWLSVKILRWLQIYDLPDSEEESKYCLELLGKILAGSSLVAEQQGSARNAFVMVLIEAINTVIHIQKTPELLETCAKILGGFLLEKSSNMRYLALDAFTRLAQVSTAAAMLVKSQQDTVTAALQDPDISIRRRALELVYGMCDKKNCKGIVGELLTFLNYLNVNIPNDFAIREELVLKIAILAEKYASQYKWYVDVMLKLITMAGDAMSDDIWFRCIKMVVNHDDVQEYATKTAYEALEAPTCNETTIKMGSFLCGEYSTLLQGTASGQKQFKLLQTKFSVSTENTKAILLSAFLKLAVHHPDVAPHVIKVYRAYSSQMNPELQQRSVEYNQLLMLQNPHLLAKITEVLPAYSDMGVQEEVLEVKQQQHHSRASSTMNTGSPQRGSLDQGMSNTTGAPPLPARSGSSVSSSSGSPVPTADYTVEQTTISTNGTTKKKKKTRKSVFGGDGEAINKEFSAVVEAATGKAPAATSSSPSSPSPNSQPTVYSDGVQSQFSTAGFGSPQAAAKPPQAAIMTLAPPAAAADSNLSPAEREAQNFNKICLTGQGILFENDLLQVGIKSEFQKGAGRVFIYFGNKSQHPFTNFDASIPPTTFVGITLTEPLAAVVEPSTQVRIGLGFQCVTPFTENSLLQLSLTFLHNGKSVHHKWDLPFTLTRFLEPTPIDASKFMTYWGQVKHASNVCTDVITAAHPINVAAISKVVQMGLRLQVLNGVDKNSNNITGAGIFYCTQGQSFALCRLETNAQAQMMRVTLKTSNPIVTAALRTLIHKALGKSVQQAASSNQ